MGTARRQQVRRWIIAASVSLGVHILLLGMMLIHRAHPALVELPTVQIALVIPPRPEERPKTAERPPERRPEPATPPPPAPRPVEAPPQVAPLPLPPAPKAAPAPTPAAPTETAST